VNRSQTSEKKGLMLFYSQPHHVGEKTHQLVHSWGISIGEGNYFGKIQKIGGVYILIIN